MASAKGVCPLCGRYIWFGSQVQRNFQLLSGLCKVQSANYTNFLAQTSHIPVQDGNLLQPPAKDPVAYGYVSPP